MGVKLVSEFERGGHKLQVLEIKVLREILGPKINEVSSSEYYISRNILIYSGYLVFL
jgi:hypothetical protein